MKPLHFQFASSYKSHVRIGFYLGGLGLGRERCQVCALPLWRQNERPGEANEKASSVSQIVITGSHLLSVWSNRADKREGRKWHHAEIISRAPSNKFSCERGHHPWYFFKLQTMRQNIGFAHFSVSGLFLSSTFNNTMFI